MRRRMRGRRSGVGRIRRRVMRNARGRRSYSRGRVRQRRLRIGYRM